MKNKLKQITYFILLNYKHILLIILLLIVAILFAKVIVTSYKLNLIVILIYNSCCALASYLTVDLFYKESE